MSDTIIYGPEFDVNVVMYSSPKANPQGGKNVNILNKTTKSKLRIQTPLMLTWGAAEYVDEKTGIGNGKFDMAWLGDDGGRHPESSKSDIDYHGEKPCSKCTISIKTIG